MNTISKINGKQINPNSLNKFKKKFQKKYYDPPKNQTIVRSTTPNLLKTNKSKKKYSIPKTNKWLKNFRTKNESQASFILIPRD